MRVSSSTARAALALALLVTACTEPDIRAELRDAGEEPSSQEPSRDAGADMDGSTDHGPMDGSVVHRDDDAASPLDDAGHAQQEDDAQVVMLMDAGADGGVNAGPVTDSGHDAGVDASAPSCVAPCECDPEPLGTVSGDSDETELQQNGTGAALLSAFVQENDHGIFNPKALTMEARLAIDGGDYDLFLYAEPSTDSCYDPSASSATAGTETAQLVFPDTGGLQGYDDSRTVVIEIRPVSGSGSWHLTVRGNVAVEPPPDGGAAP